MKVTLTLGEVVNLFGELNGNNSQDPAFKTKGVLGHKLSIRAKHILQTELSNKILEEVKAYEETRLSLFKEMVEEGKGEEKNGTYLIPPDHQAELAKKIEELESIEKKVEVPKLNVGELYNIETDEYWPILLDKVLAKKEEPTTAPTEAPVVPM
jgi:hypothetical protein